MSAPAIELAGLTLRAPVTAVTNGMLACQCAAFAWVLSSRPGGRGRLWALFFLFLGLGALAGVPKHGIPEASLEGLRLSARIASNLGIGLATATLVVLGVGATVRSPIVRRVLVGTALLQFAAFALLTVRHPAFTLVAANVVIGLGLLTPGVVRILRPSSYAAGWILAGIGTTAVGGVLYLGNVRMNTWIDHNDVGHGLVALALVFLYRGALMDGGAS